MRRFLIHQLGGAVLIVDISDVGPHAKSVPSAQFNSTEEAKQYFLGIGGTSHKLDRAVAELKQKGHALLEF